MTWPTLPAFSPNNFLDHFSSLDATKWGTITSGSGAVNVTDSYADLNAPANSAAAIYYKTQIDKTKSQLWIACWSIPTINLSGPSPLVPSLFNGASAPTADTLNNIHARQVFRRTYANQTSPAAFDQYVDGAGAAWSWDGQGSSVWTSTYTTSLASMMPIQPDDYYISGLEIDGPNSRFRAVGWCQAFATAGTWTFNQGWRLFALTDWVSWSSTRNSTNLWLVLGWPYSDQPYTSESRIEWVKYTEAPAGNTVLDAWAAGKQNVSAAHQLRHFYSLDGETFLPDDRASWSLAFGSAGTFDANELQEPWCVYDGSTTDYLFYTGTNASFVQSIGVASATHVSPQQGPWTKYASNPILTVGTSGAWDDSQVGFPCVVCDQSEADPNKRWKMLYAGRNATDTKWRTGYATAPAATGPWTKRGRVIDVGSAGANDVNAARDAVLVRYGNQWEVWYEGWDTNKACHLMRATATDLATITKDASSPYYTPGTVDQAITANLSTAPGRTVSVASTTGFNVDEIIAFSQSSNMDTWSTSRIRKIVNSTTLELYHGLTGFTTATPARMRQSSSWPNLTPRAIVQVGSQWWFYINIWEPFTNGGDGASYNALLEEGHLFKHGAAAPNGATPALQALVSPVTSRGFNNDQESLENMTIRYSPFMGDPFTILRRLGPRFRAGSRSVPC